MIRSLKKLKLWSILKKRRKKPASVPGSQQRSGHSCSCSARQPPTAPPWADANDVVAAHAGYATAAGYPPLPRSYQQYLAPSPVFGGVVMRQGAEREGAAAYCGCYAGLEALAALLRYCCCCFHQWIC